MQIEIVIQVGNDSKTYFSKQTNTGENAKQISDKFYEIVAKMDRFNLELLDGSFLVIGGNMIKNSYFIFHP